MPPVCGESANVDCVGSPFRFCVSLVKDCFAVGSDGKRDAVLASGQVDTIRDANAEGEKQLFVFFQLRQAKRVVEGRLAWRVERVVVDRRFLNVADDSVGSDGDVGCVLRLGFRQAVDQVGDDPDFAGFVRLAKRGQSAGNPSQSGQTCCQKPTRLRLHSLI